MNELTLRKLKNTNFRELYQILILNKEIPKTQQEKMLHIAVILINCKDDILNKLGYRIILKYSNKTGDYVPLYDIAINEGFIPITKYIEDIHFNHLSKKDEFFFEFQSAFEENFKNGDIYLTEEQLTLNKYFNDNNESSLIIVAPTSYGKSELIMSCIDKNPDSNICILVPTKSLLAQTKKRIINYFNYDSKRKIITHPEMYNIKDENIIAVLTQERLLKLLQLDKELFFDQLIVDEAHNLLHKDLRSQLLATSVIILRKRNQHCKVKYLTPFLLDTDNLKLDYNENEQLAFKIQENIKTENYYYYDFTNNSRLTYYDQFMNEHYLIDEKTYKSDIDLIIEKSSPKNVVYLNRPIHIEKVTQTIIKKRKNINTDFINKAIKDISSYVHNNYSLIDALKNGIVYHHGSMPDNIRLYIEHLFSTVPEINYIITTSTLLEGVNIPADTLFMLDNKKGLSNLSHAQFKNLVGRVSRFGDIFDRENGSLFKLEPSIYLIKSDYMQSNANIINFLETTVRVDRDYKDKLENVLLKKTEITEDNSDDLYNAIQFIENQEPGTINDPEVKLAKTEVGRICYKHSITEIDILTHEQSIQNTISSIRKKGILIQYPKDILEYVVSIFIEKIENNPKTQNIKRLEEDSARAFYTMFINWKIEQASYNEMIISFTRYWNKINKLEKDTIVYVGKWGDVNRYNPNRENIRLQKLWTDISTKTEIELINLAIVRIKEEQDFLENNLMKFIEAINDLGLLAPTLYSNIKYGTDDESLITIINNGIGLQTAKLLISKYREYIEIDIIENKILINNKIIQEMKSNGENEIIVYEVLNNIKI